VNCRVIQRRSPAAAREYDGLLQRENELRTAGFRAIAGLDEAGRGPLAGPVVAAAVILPPAIRLHGLDDSKKVSTANRLRLEKEIKSAAAAWGIGEASPQEIDELNILCATRLAMMRAIEALCRPGDASSFPIAPDYLLLDAIRLPLAIPQDAIVRGDAQVACISAASILAKTFRDRQMEALDACYPEYGFRAHKGYPTMFHRQILSEIGPCPIHRRSFLRSVASATRNTPAIPTKLTENGQ